MTRHFFLCVAAALICAVQLGGCTTSTCLNPQPEPPGACAPEFASGEPGGSQLQPVADAGATGGGAIVGTGGYAGTGGRAGSGGSMGAGGGAAPEGGTGGSAGNALAGDASTDASSPPDAAADAEPDAD